MFESGVNAAVEYSYASTRVRFMWLDEHLFSTIRINITRTFPVLLAMLLISCGNDAQQIDTNSIAAGLSGQSEQREIVTGDTSRATDTSSSVVPVPRDLRVTGLRSGYVSLQWTPSSGDSIRHHPAQDSVSYYRVLRNNEPFTKAFSPFIEDTNPPEGLVIYGIQAVKYASNGEFTVDYSELSEISIVVPSSRSESQQLGGIEVNATTFNDELRLSQNCINAFQRTDGAVLCVDQTGGVWADSLLDGSGEKLALTSASVNGLLVAAENQPAVLGPIPDIPTWSVVQLATGNTYQGTLQLDAHLQTGERHLVNGVVVSDNDEIFVSGTVYQSYIPRSLGPAPGVLPVTNAYYVLQLNAQTGAILQFKRFALADAPGAVSSINNGALQLFHTGLITWLEITSLGINAQLRVTGKPILEKEGFVYTEAASGGNQPSYFRFEL